MEGGGGGDGVFRITAHSIGDMKEWIKGSKQTKKACR